MYTVQIYEAIKNHCELTLVSPPPKDLQLEQVGRNKNSGLSRECNVTNDERPVDRWGRVAPSPRRVPRTCAYAASRELSCLRSRPPVARIPARRVTCRLSTRTRAPATRKKQRAEGRDARRWPGRTRDSRARRRVHSPYPIPPPSRRTRATCEPTRSASTVLQYAAYEYTMCAVEKWEDGARTRDWCPRRGTRPRRTAAQSAARRCSPHSRAASPAAASATWPPRSPAHTRCSPVPYWNDTFVKTGTKKERKFDEIRSNAKSANTNNLNCTSMASTIIITIKMRVYFVRLWF